jgi:hypothetical protein
MHHISPPAATCADLKYVTDLLLLLKLGGTLLSCLLLTLALLQKSLGNENMVRSGDASVSGQSVVPHT